MDLTQLRKIADEVIEELENKNEKDQDDYTVFGTWFVEKEEFTRQESIGEVMLPEDATAKDMPEELEINGFTYKLEK